MVLGQNRVQTRQNMHRGVVDVLTCPMLERRGPLSWICYGLWVRLAKVHAAGPCLRGLG